MNNTVIVSRNVLKSPDILLWECVKAAKKDGMSLRAFLALARLAWKYSDIVGE